MKNAPPFIVESIRAHQVQRAEAEASGEQMPFDWSRVIRRLAKLAERQHTEHAVLSPSGIGGIVNDRKCTRQLVYKCQRTPKQKMSPRSQATFDDGLLHEAKTLADIDHTHWLVTDEELRLQCWHGVHGFSDALISMPAELAKITGHRRYLFEHKSISHDGFKNMLSVDKHGASDDYTARLVKQRDNKYVWRNQRTGPKPLESHVVQINSYWRGLLNRGLEVDGAVIIYKSKNTGAMAEFFLPEFDEALADATFERIEEVRELADKPTLPAPEFVLGEDWQCNYCQYSERCQGTLPERKEVKQYRELKPEVIAACKHAELMRQQRLRAKYEEDAAKHTIIVALQNTGASVKLDARAITAISKLNTKEQP
jgi:hypothetical protein